MKIDFTKVQMHKQVLWKSTTTSQGTYHFTFCDQRTFVIMHNL